MKKGIFTAVILIMCLFVKADEILLNSVYSQDTIIHPFSNFEDSVIYSLKIDNSSLVLNSDTSLVRIVLIDNKGVNYLIAESYSVLDNSDSLSFEKYGEETLWLNGIRPQSIKIIIDDASLSVGSLILDCKNPNLTQAYIKQQKEQQLQDKISRLNSSLSNQEYPWRAGNTAVSSLSYMKKMEYFGERFKDGYEYYESGFFVTPSFSNVKASNEIVKRFDWRKRHNADKVGFPYFDGDTQGSGWLAPPSYQNGCLLGGYVQYLNCTDCENAGGIYVEAPTCWAFGPIAAIETVTNLYFNRHLDIEISQQEIVSCAWSDGANAGYVSNTLSLGI